MSSLPLRHLVAQALLGDQESIESVLLPDVYSSGGSRNLSIDKDGRISSILGYVKQNAAAVKSNTGAAAERLRGLYHYVSQSGGVATRQEIGIFTDDGTHWEFRKSTDQGATWVFVNDYGAGSANKIPDFAASGNLLILTNGTIAPGQWDGTTLTTAGSTQLAAPTYAKTGAGVLSGNVGWRVLPMVGNVRKLASVQSVNYALNAEAGTLTWVADPDVTVTGYEVYRTTGTGSIFYYEGSVVGRLTVTLAVGTATDTDANLIIGRVLQEFGDPPPVGAYFCVAHKERMFYLRTDTNPRTAYYSDPGVPYSVYTAFNKVDFTDAVSFTDVCTGGTGDFLGTFVLWQERSVWTLSGTGEIVGTVRDFTRRRTDAVMGTVSHRTVTKIPLGAAYTDAEGNVKRTTQVTLAYLTPLKDIRLFDGNNDEIISFPKKITLSTMSYASRAKSFCVHDHQRSEVTWVYADSAGTEPSVGVTWNYRWGTWYTRDWPFACGIEIETPNTASLLLAGEALTANGGFCYQLWSGFTFNGQAIASQWMTKTLFGQGTFGDPPGLYGKPLISLTKRWRWVDLLFDISGGQTSIVIEWLRGDDSPDSQAAYGSRTLAIPQAIVETLDNVIIETADNVEIGVTTTPALIRAKIQRASDGRYLHSRGCRLRFKLSSSTAQWFLSAMDTAFQMLPGEKRTVNG